MISALDSLLEGQAEGLDQVVWITKPGVGGALFASAGFEAFWGGPAVVLLEDETGWLARVHPVDRERVERAVGDDAAVGRVDQTFRLAPTDGYIRDVRVRRVALIEEAGLGVHLWTGSAVTETPEGSASVRLDDEELFSFAQRVGEMGSWRWTRDPNGVRYSKEMLELHRVTEGFFGDSFEGYLAHVHHEDRARMIATAEGAWEGHTPPLEYRFVSADGSVQHMLGNASLVSDAEGRPLRLEGTVHDITRRVEAQHEVERIAAQLAEYFQRVPTPAFKWRSEGDDLVLVGFNVSAEAELGEGSGLLGTRASQFYGDRHRVDDLLRCAAGETFTRDISRESAVPGEAFNLVVTYVHMPPDIAAEHVLDVSERIRLDKALRASRDTAQGILDASREPIMLIDATGALLSMNRALYTALGMTEEELLGVSVFDIVPPETSAARRAAVEEVFSTGRPLLAEEDRSGRHFRNRLYPIMDDGGRVANVVVFVEETTEETRAKEELLRSRARHEQAQRIAHLGHWEWDVAADVLWWSDEVYRIFGVDPEDFKATKGAFRSYVYPDDLPEVDARLRHAMATTAPYEVVHRVVRRNGGIRTVREQAEVMVGADGSQRLVGTVLDVTELKEAEESAKSREADLLALMEGNPDGISLSVDGKIEFCNSALVTISGRSKAEVVGGSILDFLVPGDRQRAMKRTTAILSGASLGPTEYHGLRPDGAVIPLEVYSAPLEFRGRPAVISTIRDISERKEAEGAVSRAEERYRALFEQSPSGVVLVDPEECSVVAFNPRLPEVTGYTPEVLLGMPLWELDATHTADELRRVVQAVLRGEITELDSSVRCADGSTRDVVLRPRVLDLAGEPLIMMLLQDITERKRAESALAESRDLLRELVRHREAVREEERAQVARDLHDDLGSVLTALKMDLSDVGQQAAALPEVGDRIGAMLHLVDEAIDVGRRVTARLRPGILDDLGLAAAVDWLGSDLERRTGTTCEVHIGEVPDLPEPVATAMFRILQEAFTNVIRHSGAGHVLVELSCEGGWVTLQVTDNGTGFDPSASSPSGFGLLGMRERAAALSGEVRVESREGDGTALSVRIPFRGDVV